MVKPSDFGLFLKEKRKAAHLTQDDLASAINKSGQYISNIEKGKNNAPPNPSDIEALIRRLGLSNDEANLFKEKASADRGRLPIEQMDYLMKHPVKPLLADADFKVYIATPRMPEVHIIRRKAVYLTHCSALFAAHCLTAQMLHYPIVCDPVASAASQIRSAKQNLVDLQGVQCL